MQLRSLGPVLLFIFFFTAASFASNQPDAAKALDLLQRVSQHYAQAKSYRIEELQERTITSDLMHQWERMLFTAAEAPGGRHYFEGHSSMGSAIAVSDGTAEWLYHIEENAYTKKSASLKDPTRISPIAEMALIQAGHLRDVLGNMASHYQSAELLPDADLTLDGKQISCHRIHLRGADRKRIDPNVQFDMVLWIDKAHETIVKTDERTDGFLLSGNARIFQQGETMTLYPRVELDETVPGNFFTFTPPADAQLLNDFPSPLASNGGSNLMGRLFPSLKLKAENGTVVSLDSFRGKPILIDLWATWCAPCIQAMPQFDELYRETKDKGLIVISIDRDEDAKHASDFLASKGYHWQNFHDNGNVESALGESGIPRTLLIDAQGKVVFDHTAFVEDELRREIAKLGPEYASIAPKPAAIPCVVAKQ